LSAGFSRWREQEQQWYYVLTYGLLSAMVLVAIVVPNIWTALSAIGEWAGAGVGVGGCGSWRWNACRRMACVLYGMVRQCIRGAIDRKQCACSKASM
jgi:hypothetical protein